MTTPTQRHTKSRRNKRRSHLRLSSVLLARCAKCGNAVLPHVICENCGAYRGKAMIDVLAKLDKKERKRREKDQKEYAKDKESTPSGSLEELSRK
jgi:large subunit ribosomal protein L32